MLSTRREDGIEAASCRLADHLEDHPTQSLADVAFTLQQGRAALAHRRAVVCRSVEEARRARCPGAAPPRPAERARGRVPVPGRRQPARRHGRGALPQRAGLPRGDRSLRRPVRPRARR
ncbi:hypothetical protein [Nannocystis pusilla]|uniref:CurL C-terminal domain-containing protein n=1 Tax=Nannocystis pusilla TaxID=889268 RepID=UPI003B7D4F8E